MFRAAGTPIVFLFLMLLNLPSAELDMMDFGKCNQPLGMADGRIKNEDIRVTSSLDPNHDSNSARLGHTDKEGRITAWCPLLLEHTRLEYILVKLTKEHLITRVERRLFSENGNEIKDTEPADGKFMQYTRPMLGGFTYAKFKNNLQELDSPDASLLKPFRANSVAIGFDFYNLHHETKYCLQVEIYGCPVSDGIVSYDAKGPLFHMNYDGTIDHELFSNGLGELVDGNFGDQFLTETDYLTPDSLRISDNGWIGWHKLWFYNLPLELIFKFDRVRQFFEMVVYALNIIATEEIRPFLLAKVHFSNDSINYVEHYSIVYHANEAAAQINQNINVPLKQRSAQYLKIQFFLDTEWMFISEITFNSSSNEAHTDDTKVNEGSASANNPWSFGRILICFVVSAILMGLLIIPPFIWLIIKLRRVILINRLNDANEEVMLNTIGRKTQFPLRP